MDNAAHTLKVTRDAGGNYELFVDGASAGTAASTFVPVPSRLRIFNQANQAVDVSHLTVS